MVWYGMVWYGVVWYGMVWYGMVKTASVWKLACCVNLEELPGEYLMTKQHTTPAGNRGQSSHNALEQITDNQNSNGIFLLSS